MEHLHGTPRRRLVGAAARASRAVGALLPLLGALYVGARAVVASADVPDRLDRAGDPDRVATVAPRRVAPERITSENVGRLRLTWSHRAGDGVASRFDPVARDSGGAPPHAMAVIPTGVAFAAGRDGLVYARDVATGAVRWSASLPATTVGPPVLYETGGGQYLVVRASLPLPAGLGQGGYLVFTLPAP